MILKMVCIKRSEDAMKSKDGKPCSLWSYDFGVEGGADIEVVGQLHIESKKQLHYKAGKKYDVDITTSLMLEVVS